MAEWIIEIQDGFPNLKKMTPLVRCKDCVYADERLGVLLCDFHKDSHIAKEDDFCSRGERRKDG